MSTTFIRGENPLKADKLNAAFSERVSRRGDTMQGSLNLAHDPLAPLEAATKQYVDHFANSGSLTVPTGAYIGATPPGSVPAPLWWDSVSGQLFIQYNDGSSTQWVAASSLDMSMLDSRFLLISGGTMQGPLNYMTTGGTVSRSAQDRAAEVVNVKDYGAKGDGTTDDAAAITAAIGSGGREVWFPPGTYRLASRVSAALTSSITLRGTGAGVTILSATNAGGIALTPAVVKGITVADMTIVNAGTTTGGTGLDITSATANNGPLSLLNVTFGAMELTAGFATNVNLLNISDITISNCRFRFPGGSTSTGTHLAFDGSATFPAINTKISDCFFHLGTVGVRIGDGTNSDVQGVNISNSIFVETGTCVRWRQGSGSLADALQISNSQLNYGTGPGIDVDHILHLQLVGNYIFGGISTSQVLINNPMDTVIVGNSFFANGGANLVGVNLTGTNNVGGVGVFGNSFFGFNGAGSVPVTIGASVSLTTVEANAYQSCSAFVIDNGSGNTVSYAQNGNLTVTGGSIVMSASTPAFIMGALSGGGGTPYIDFHSSGHSGQDVRIMVSGGGGTPDGGVMSISAYLIQSTQLKLSGGIGLWNGNPPGAKPTVTGAKGGNAALASLLTALTSYGLVTDSTT